MHTYVNCHTDDDGDDPGSSNTIYTLLILNEVTNSLLQKKERLISRLIGAKSVVWQALEV
jgi:hypothetical protein